MNDDTESISVTIQVRRVFNNDEATYLPDFEDDLQDFLSDWFSDGVSEVSIDVTTTQEIT